MISTVSTCNIIEKKSQNSSFFWAKNVCNERLRTYLSSFVAVAIAVAILMEPAPVTYLSRLEIIWSSNNIMATVVVW